MADIMPQGAAIDGDDDDILIDTTEGAAGDAAVPDLEEDAGPKLPHGATRQEDGSVIYDLQYSCAIRYRRKSDGATREETLTRLHLHRLKGGDMMKIQAASQDMMVPVAIACSARVPENEHHKMRLFIREMDAADVAAVQEVVLGFLGTGRPTGR